MGLLDKILPPPDYIRCLQEKQRELEKHCRQYKGAATQQQEDECKKRS